MKFACDYRRDAWGALKGQSGTAMLALIVFGLIMGATSATLVGGILLVGPMMVGYSILWINLFRRGSIDLGDMFTGFNNFGNTLVMGLLTAIFVSLWSLLFVIPGIIACYRYSMAPYILADHPEMGGYEAICASAKLMRGKKWRLFCLDFSFIGWLILCTLTFGILYLWVGPAMQTARASFYEDIRDEIEA